MFTKWPFNRDVKESSLGIRKMMPLKIHTYTNEWRVIESVNIWGNIKYLPIFILFNINW